MKKYPLTTIIERENDMMISYCPELDIASQGHTVEEARENLKEAIELFFETASESEIRSRLKSEIYIRRQKGSHIVMQKKSLDSTITVPVPNHSETKIGTLQSIIR